MKRFLRISIRIAAVLLVAAAILVGRHWWNQRQSEHYVAYWIDNAEQCMATGNYEEARKTLEMLIRRFPESWLMGRAHYAMGRLQLDYLGSLAAAQHYFAAQVRRHPFNRQTPASLRKLAYINRMSGFDTEHGDKPYREFVLARRVLLSGRFDEGAGLLREIVATWPESAVAPEALLALGNHFLEDRRLPSRARPYFTRLQERYPSSEAAARIPPAEIRAAPDPPPTPIERS